jgi:hypothetical protein
MLLSSVLTLQNLSSPCPGVIQPRNILIVKVAGRLSDSFASIGTGGLPFTMGRVKTRLQWRLI